MTQLRKFPVAAICLCFLSLAGCGPEVDFYTKTDYGNALSESFLCPTDSIALFTQVDDPNTGLTLNVPEGFSGFAYVDGEFGYSGIEAREIDPEFEFDKDFFSISIYRDSVTYDNLIHYSMDRKVDLYRNGGTIVDYGKTIAFGKRAVWVIYYFRASQEDIIFKRLELAFFALDKEHVHVLKYGARMTYDWDENICRMMKVKQL